MDKDYTRIFRRTGIFVVFTLLVLLVFLGIIVNRQKLFVRRHSYFTILEDAVGLTVSAPVIFKGHEIGKVRQFYFNEDNDIEVRFFIYNEFIEMIVVNSAITKNHNPITGRSNLEFLKGSAGGEVIEEFSLIPSLYMEKGKRLLAERKISSRGDPVGNLMRDVADFVANLNMDDNYDQGSFFRMLYHLAYAVENLNHSMENLNTLIVALQDDHNQDSGVLLRVLVNIADLTEEVQVSNSLLAANMAELNQFLKNYGQPDGLLQRMIDPTEEVFIQPLEKSIDMLNTNLEEMHRILEFLYIKTPELSVLMSESRRSLSDLRKAMEGLRHNPLIRGGIREEAEPAPGQRIRPQEIEQ